MTRNDDGLSRRSFIGGVASGVAVAAMHGQVSLAGPARARVVRVESDSLWDADRRDEGVLARMLDAGLTSLTGTESAVAAWKQLLPAGARVGVKINLLGRPYLVTAPEVTAAVVGGVLDAGWTSDQVTVWDRYAEHFRRSGYRAGKGSRGEAIEAGGSYDSARKARTSGGPVPIDRMVTERTDVTVSLPVLKDHGGAGVTGALKNIAFGAYDHHPTAHEGACDPYIAEAYAHYAAVARQPVIILDATEGCFDGGPRPSDRSRIWREGALYLATDPVALDVVVRDLIQARRRAAGLPDTTSRCRHIATAAKMGLGVGDRERIDVTTVSV